MALGQRLNQWMSTALNTDSMVGGFEEAAIRARQNLRQKFAVGPEMGRTARAYHSFWGQAFTGQRSWQEVASRAGGYTQAVRGRAAHQTMKYSVSSITGRTAASADIGAFWKNWGHHGVRSAGKGFVKGGSMMGAGTAIFLPLDIGLRMASGEKGWEATMRAAGGTVGGVAGGAVAGAMVGSIVPGAGTVVGAIIGGMVGYAGGEQMGEAGVRFTRHLTEKGRRINRAELGGRMSAAASTRAAATMRARSLQQMSKSGINARSLLGREAQMLHR